MKKYFISALFLGTILLGGNFASALEIPKIVAHRGFSAIAPENTLASIRKAGEIGAGGSECDVYVTKDGVVCLMHDGTTARTSNGKTNLSMAQSTWDQLKDICVPARTIGYENEKIPSLEQALKCHKEECPNCAPVIEIKDARAALGVIEELKKADMLDKAFIISFSSEAVGIVKQNSDVLTAHLFGKLQTPEDVRTAAKRAKALGAEMIDILYHKDMTEEHIKAGHDEGLKVWVWTINDLESMKHALAIGADSVTTDRPDLMKIALGTSGETSEWNVQSGELSNDQNFTPKKSAIVSLGTEKNPNCSAALTSGTETFELLNLAVVKESSAKLTISNAQIDAVLLNVGQCGRGEVVLDESSKLCTSCLFLGQEGSSEGKLTLNGTLQTFSLSVGDQAQTTGELILNGGKLTSLGKVDFGGRGKAKITQNGGEFTIGNGNLLFGESREGSAEYTLNGGTFTVKRAFSLGSGGEGYLNICGGEFSIDGQFVIGFYSGKSIVRQTGGTANIRGTASGWGVRTNPGFIEGYSTDQMNSYCAGVQFAGTAHGSNTLRGGETGEYYLSGGTLNTLRLFSMTTGKKPLFFLSGTGEANVLPDPEIPYSGLLAAPTRMTGGTLRVQTILAKNYMQNDTFVQEGGVFQPFRRAKVDGTYVLEKGTLLLGVRSDSKYTRLEVTDKFEVKDGTFVVKVHENFVDSLKSGEKVQLQFFTEAQPKGNFTFKLEASDKIQLNTDKFASEGIVELWVK